MPVFVPGGPFIPDEVVQDLEDDQLVLFCGAGISIRAGLPSFGGLVEHIYKTLKEPLPTDPAAWIWPDRMLRGIEIKFSAEQFRQALVGHLNKRPKTLDIHKAIMRLAQLRSTGRPRLVSTNFDRYLPMAAKQLGLTFEEHDAPALPIPRNDRLRSWCSLVHLHGKLKRNASNDHLVVTSADFGRAYLRDGYATKFVVELVGSFSVLFIGYSLNDPVMRYMMDAFAADRGIRRDAARQRAYIFVAEDNPVPAEEWQRRGITPVRYSAADDHAALRLTLAEWAKARDDWLSNKERVIRSIAAKGPGTLDPSDQSNLTWALAGGGPDDHFGASVLARDREVAVAKFPGSKAGQATLLAGLSTSGAHHPMPTPVEICVASWLVQHLDSVPVLGWALEQWQASRHLALPLRDIIRQRLPMGPPLSAAYEAVWRVLSGASFQPRALDVWHLDATLRRLKDGLPDAEIRLEALGLLKPQLTLRPVLKAPASEEAAGPEVEFKVYQLVDADVRLVGEDYLQDLWMDLGGWTDRRETLAAIADQLTSLLLEALELWGAIKGASETWDPSVLHQPSIAPHPQNNGLYSWTRLIDLLWIGWRHLDQTDRTGSRALVNRWRQIKYPTFRRMVLAALSESTNWTAQEKLDVLLN